jgi:hypothetical protein
VARIPRRVLWPDLPRTLKGCGTISVAIRDRGPNPQQMLSTVLWEVGLENHVARSAPASDVPTPVYDRLTEGFGTANLVAARTLLSSVR